MRTSNDILPDLFLRGFLSLSKARHARLGLETAMDKDGTVVVVVVVVSRPPSALFFPSFPSRSVLVRWELFEADYWSAVTGFNT